MRAYFFRHVDNISAMMRESRLRQPEAYDGSVWKCLQMWIDQGGLYVVYSIAERTLFMLMPTSQLLMFNDETAYSSGKRDGWETPVVDNFSSGQVRDSRTIDCVLLWRSGSSHFAPRVRLRNIPPEGRRQKQT